MEQNKLMKYSKHNWINDPSEILNLESEINIKTIYFLYGFLGDDFNIENQSYIKNLEKWRMLNPNYKIKIIRESYDKINSLVETHFPDFYPIYKNYPKNIQRCDIFRYMLMYLFGGVYSDLDVIPNISLYNFIYTRKFGKQSLSWANVIFGISRVKDKDKCEKATLYETIRNGEPEIPIKISNYLFLSRIPNHPIWIDIIKLAKKRSQSTLRSQYGIIYSTGPDLVTTALSQNRHKYNDIAIIPIEEFNKMFLHEMSGSWRTKGFQLCETNINTT